MKLESKSSTKMVLENYNLDLFVSSMLVALTGVYIVLFHSNDNILDSVLGGIIAFAGVFSILSIKVITATLDHTTSQGVFNFRGITGHKRNINPPHDSSFGLFKLSC